MMGLDLIPVWEKIGVSSFFHRKNELTLRQEARERRIISNVKPFIGTLRVTNPVRQSRASSRKRVLRGGWVTAPAKRRQRDQTLCD
jgi:hypothetical protein